MRLGGNAEALRDERVQRRFRQTARAALVTPGFQRARAGRKLETQVLLGQVIQQMHKRKRGAEHEHGLPASARRSQPLQRSLQIQCPGAIPSHPSDKRRSARASLAPNGLEHVDQRGVRRLCGRRGEDGHLAFAICHWKCASNHRQQRCLIKRQRLGIVEVPAWPLPRRAAGMEDRSSAPPPADTKARTP